MNNVVTSMIDKIINEKLFTLNNMEVLRAQAQQLEETCETFRKKCGAFSEALTQEQTTNKELADRLSAAINTINEWAAREQNITERESSVLEIQTKFLDLEKRAAISEAQALAYKDALKTIFSNPTYP